MNIPNVTALASTAAPIAKIRAPMAIARVLPRLSDNAPANKVTTAAAIKIVDTTTPVTAGERAPEVWVKDGICITGPMLLVSILFKSLEIREVF